MKRLLPFALTLCVAAPALAQDPPPAEELPPDAPITKLPSLKVNAEAEYPQAALRERISARVELEIDIGASGLVEGVTVVRTSTQAEVETGTSTITDYGFAAAAERAAKALEFNPAESNGTPIPVRIGYAFNFAPPPPPPPPTVTATATETSSVTAPPPPGIANFIGDIRERGTRSLLAGVVVTVFRQIGDEVVAFETTTDAEGHFEFFDLEPGVWKIQGEKTAYFPLRDAEKVEPDKVTDVTYFIEKGSYDPYEIVITGERVIKEVNRRTLTRDEILKVPGTLGDPITVVENLPGVARTTGGNIIVRGSGPQDTGIFIDDIDVPLIFHFGALKSVIPADVIDTVEFYPGNFSVYYGRATGGIFNARLRKLEPDTLHGSLDVSLLDTSIFAQTPIPGIDGLYLAVGGRRSYVDVLIEAAVPDDSDVGIVSAPRYYDYQVLANYRPNNRHDARAILLGSDDVFEALFANPGDLDAQITATNLRATAGFQIGILEYFYTPSASFRNEFRASVGNNSTGAALGDQFFFFLDVMTIQFRDNVEWMPTDWLNLNFGVDGLLQVADVRVRAPGGLPSEGQTANGGNDLDEVLETSVQGDFFGFIAPYAEAKIDLLDDRLSIVPGIRMDWWGQTESFTFDPRITARYAVTEDKQWWVKGGVGFVHQEPFAPQLDETFGNPDLEVQQAIQYSIGGEWTPTDATRIDVTVFVKDLNNLVSPTTAVNASGDPLNFDNNGTGLVYGAEIFAEQKLTKNFRGFLSYTISRAQRIDSGETESRLFDFDQTHILALVASYLLPENWEIGLRWRLVSGSPSTPFVSGVFQNNQDEYNPIPGLVNSERLPFFHQLDLRVDKTWIFDFWRFTAYLSILNTYNRQNSEGFSYNFDFTARDTISSLPILPILGVKAEF